MSYEVWEVRDGAVVEGVEAAVEGEGEGEEEKRRGSSGEEQGHDGTEGDVERNC